MSSYSFHISSFQKQYFATSWCILDALWRILGDFSWNKLEDGWASCKLLRLRNKSCCKMVCWVTAFSFHPPFFFFFLSGCFSPVRIKQYGEIVKLDQRIWCLFFCVYTKLYQFLKHFIFWFLLSYHGTKNLFSDENYTVGLWKYQIQFYIR